MRKRIYKILITGGAGFIGSAFIRLLLKESLFFNAEVIVIDKLTYAGDLQRLREVVGRYKFYKADICNKKIIGAIFKKERPDFVLNFAAQTHVDRSILDSRPFIDTNVVGTQILMDTSRKYKIKKFIHISTDEIYGEIRKGKFKEDSPLGPNNPYAASKAAADLFIKSYSKTYGFPSIIVRPCNNCGPWQYPEKLIPLTISKILNNEKIPLYGDGINIREWLYVEDCARGILQILQKGKVGEIYNLGSQQEKQNREVVKTVLKILKKGQNLIESVKDRPGHDFRYALDSSKVTSLGWKPKYNFIQSLKLTIDWYLKNVSWWQKINQRKEYRSYYRTWYIRRDLC